ncbi:unnamed protein product [Amoebophrya sp. A120]|nr:unnamed protein product [Amoebophrya sp. A120]|eukprot:GSA120T00013901001.1
MPSSGLSHFLQTLSTTGPEFPGYMTSGETSSSNTRASFSNTSSTATSFFDSALWPLQTSGTSARQLARGRSLEQGGSTTKMLAPQNSYHHPRHPSWTPSSFLPNASQLDQIIKKTRQVLDKADEVNLQQARNVGIKSVMQTGADLLGNVEQAARAFEEDLQNALVAYKGNVPNSEAASGLEKLQKAQVTMDKMIQKLDK